MTKTPLRRESDTKGKLIGKIVAATRGKGPFRNRNELKGFLEQYYKNVAIEDLRESNPDYLAAAALSHLNLGTTRTPGIHNIRIYNPTAERTGWESTHTIIELVNDDMPFLVDSITMAIDRAGLGVHLTVHPLIRIQRNDDDQIRRFFPSDATDGAVESFIRCEVDRVSAKSTFRKLTEEIESTLSDVRATVEDWPEMRRQMRDCAQQIDATILPVDPTLVSESSHLLEWMAENRFTFLGYQEYTLARKKRHLVLQPVPDSGLGLLADQRHESGEIVLTAAMERHALSKDLLIITKANSRATVHRPSFLDYVGIKTYDEKGKITGERRFLGLFTSVAYSESPRKIPLLRLKVHRVIERSGLNMSSHRGKALLHILDTYPRDEILQTSVRDLARTTTAILNLQDRRQVRLFLRRDAFRRFFSCLIYVPREKYNTRIRHKIEKILLETFGGNSVDSTVEISDSALARLHSIVRTTPEDTPSISIQQIERDIANAVVTWQDHLREMLVDHYGEEDGLDYCEKYGGMFPLAYEEDTPPKIASYDVRRVHAIVSNTAEISDRLILYRPKNTRTRTQLNFKLVSTERPLPLSNALPVLENMGVRVLNERPYCLTLTDGKNVWIQDFELSCEAADKLDLQALSDQFAECFDSVVRGKTENDSFNQLVVQPGLTGRQIVLVRAYAKYLLQLGIPFSQRYMETVLGTHSNFVRLFVDLFSARFDPSGTKKNRAKREQKIGNSLRNAIQKAVTLDEDRILRAFLGALKASVRTNYFQKAESGVCKPVLAIKLRPQQLDEAPRPRPEFEISVYSPRVEGVHLRAGGIARGGIRWSDRREDFRTEILGLMKAQTVKNTVIVPTGAKGGFVPKNLPRSDRAAVMAEVVGSYKDFIGGLLDVTDNLVDEKIRPPADTVRHDSDDPYLVVAADKGTAAFSDIANGISESRGFWLGDAFASGGSAGYDHKKMGITARGAWEAVRRHFSELGLNTQSDPFTVVGIGDMGGDVFGNGMLLSKTIQIVAAFNHMHIFVDPNPDAAKSYKERKRLFRMKRSSWDDYDRSLISRGGGIFERSAKKIKLSREVRELFDIEESALAPHELIRYMLKAPVDLLWNGGIGTYVKADAESNGDAGDRANDALRVNASQLRARVVGEGGNLGLTQAARIEYSLTGGKINTDFIDNSAGVDSSDREVNIKILLNLVARKKRFPVATRNKLLADMTKEVASLVLRNNYLQTQSISMVESRAPERLQEHSQFIRSLEGAGLLNRTLEGLPNEEEFEQRRRLQQGLTRPELAVLLSYAKIDLYNALSSRTFDIQKYHLQELSAYFPAPLPTRYRDLLSEHRLHREILATMITNSIINRMGPGFVRRICQETGVAPAVVTRAYTIGRDVTGARDIWRAIEGLDYKISATSQYAMMFEVSRRLRHVTFWLIKHKGTDMQLDELIGSIGPALRKLYRSLPSLLSGLGASELQRAETEYRNLGAPNELASQMATLASTTSLLDVVDVSGKNEKNLHRAAEIYFLLVDQLGVAWLQLKIDELKAGDQWQALARSALRDTIQYSLHGISRNLLKKRTDASSANVVQSWIGDSGSGAERFLQLIREIRNTGNADYATLSVAVERLQHLVSD